MDSKIEEIQAKYGNMSLDDAIAKKKAIRKKPAH